MTDTPDPPDGDPADRYDGLPAAWSESAKETHVQVEEANPQLDPVRAGSLFEACGLIALADVMQEQLDADGLMIDSSRATCCPSAHLRDSGSARAGPVGAPRPRPRTQPVHRVEVRRRPRRETVARPDGRCPRPALGAVVRRGRPVRRPGTGPLPGAFGGPDLRRTADSALRFRTLADADAWRAEQGLPPTVPVMTAAEVHQYTTTGEQPESYRARRAEWDAEHGPFVHAPEDAVLLEGLSPPT